MEEGVQKEWLIAGSARSHPPGTAAFIHIQNI
jgi:hypothetical protein